MINGWGKFRGYKSKLFFPSSVNKLKKLLITKKYKNFIVRGGGRSYGDSSLNKNIIILDFNKNLIKINSAKKFVHCGGSVTLKELNEKLIKKNLFLKVTPGTQYVTVGGAIASDIHGKNHHVDGSFCDHVEKLKILLADGSIKECSKNKNSDLFVSTCGGMGLTGIILSAKFKLQSLPSNSVIENFIKTNSLKETLELFDFKNKHKYIVGWLDMSAKGKNTGRGIVYFADHHTKNTKNIIQNFKIKFNFPNFFLNNFTLKILSRIFYITRKRKDKKIINFKKFFYTLDNILNWNKFYGSKGFVQIQILINTDNSYQNLKKIISFFQSENQYSFVTTLKKMGKSNKSLLGFAKPGYTITFDIPNNRNLQNFYKKLEKKLILMNAKIYLTKDSLMTKRYFQKTYPNLNQFLKYKSKFDPKGKFGSFQSARLGIK